MITLFPDQQELVNRVRAAMTKSKAILLQSPTGSGKTAMATHMIHAARNKNNKIIFTLPRKDLCEQTSESFTENGIAHSYIAAGKPHNPYSNVYIGMIDTMARRLDKLPASKLVICDETHFGDGALDKVISHYKAQGAWILGLSATPTKTNGKGMDCWYDTLVQGHSIRWLIDNKRLSDYKYYRGVTSLDLTKLRVQNGDYNKQDVAGYMEEQNVVIGDCVRDYRLRCMGNIHIVRCASIKHSQMMAAAFNSEGISAVHVDGNTEIPERKQIFRAFARREILVICFCDLLNFGFDLSQMTGMNVCIESGSDMKPSKSLAAEMQFRGRLLRYKEKPAIINDHTNNWEEFGLPCDEVEWSLEGTKSRAGGEKEKTISVRQCTACFYCHTPAPQCPQCGHIYPIQARELEHVEGELVELTREMIKSKARQEQGSMRTLEQLIAHGRAKGYAKPEQWAAHVFSARMRKG